MEKRKIEKRITIALWVAGIFFALFIMHLSQKNYVQRELRGTVIKKFEDKKYKNTPTLKIMFNNDKGSVITKYLSGYGYCFDLYKDAVVGDSIIKEIGNTDRFILKKRDGTVNSYFHVSFLGCHAYTIDNRQNKLR